MYACATFIFVLCGAAINQGVIKILLNGKFVAVTRKGSGSPVLLLHGYLSSKESFYYQTQALAANGFCCVAPDMPAFGASDMIDYPWSVGDYAEWLKLFIAANGLKGADVIAHSFGARVAIKLLSADNSLCNRLIITGGAGIVKPRSPRYMRQVKRYRRVKKLFPRYAEKHVGSEEYRSLSPLMKESYKKIVNTDLSAEAALVFNKTLLIYGNKDRVTPAYEEGETFARLMPNGRLTVIDGGHFCFSENAERFNTLMLGFLRGVQP